MMGGGRYRGRRSRLQAASAERTVTVTYRYGDALLTLVAPTRAAADADALARWGEWDGEPCYSTPITIYNDLTGETQRRLSRRGMYHDGAI
jgi:hypothetical protein